MIFKHNDLINKKFNYDHIYFIFILNPFFLFTFIIFGLGF